MSTRREFLQKSLLAGIGISVLGKSVLNAGTISPETFMLDGKYTVPPLPYAFDALEPWIDMKTMQVHHDKHHQSYVDNLNKALEEEKKKPGGEKIETQPVIISDDEAPEEVSIWADLEERFKTISSAPVAIRNHGGGHWNHSFFWEIMKPNKEGIANLPIGTLNDDITTTFGSFEKFQDQFHKAALGRFGSGWAWLILKDGKLVITSTPNQDNPLMDVAEVQGRPILGLDVWEHAYYLKHQSARGTYIADWWKVVNWGKVSQHYAGRK